MKKYVPQSEHLNILDTAAKLRQCLTYILKNGISLDSSRVRFKSCAILPIDNDKNLIMFIGFDDKIIKVCNY